MAHGKDAKQVYAVEQARGETEIFCKWRILINHFSHSDQFLEFTNPVFNQLLFSHRSIIFSVFFGIIHLPSILETLSKLRSFGSF